MYWESELRAECSGKPECQCALCAMPRVFVPTSLLEHDEIEIVYTSFLGVPIIELRYKPTVSFPPPSGLGGGGK